jgi:hypothetical protein
LFGFGSCDFVAAVVVFNAFELFVGEHEGCDGTFFWEVGTDFFYVSFGGFDRRAVADVNGVLHHVESLLFEEFFESCVFVPVGFGFYGQVEECEYPHDTICTYSLRHISG